LSEVFKASAPGRVNLIGEHTDYNGGFVLPSAIPQRTEVKLTARSDLRISGRSANADKSFEYTLGQEKKSGLWWDYVQGVTFALRSEKALVEKVRGFEVEISSQVPLGSGLSSSAALEVALLRAIRSAFDLAGLDDILIAKLGQKAENDFVGARVGVMDQMAASLADEGTALFLDTRSFESRKVALPSSAELAVINSGIAHRNSSGDYNTRRAECEAACKELGIRELRDLSDLKSAAFQSLPEILRRRAKHVVTENQRVLDTVLAMEAQDPEKMGRLFSESHASMRDDYEVSIPEIDELVRIAGSHAEVFGARLTGGGFGGSIVILCQKGKARQVSKAVAEEYRLKTGESPSVLVP
jgi:galactokinase